MISGRSSETTYEQTGELEAGKDLLGHGGAAEDVAPLEDEHLSARAREVGGVDEAVVAAADDDDVVGHESSKSEDPDAPNGEPRAAKVYH